jgi:dihydropteroate synthase
MVIDPVAPFSRPQFMNIKGNLRTFQYPAVMGILNITRDSFYDGGRFARFEKALHHCEHMLDGGAQIIDIGAQSTRPGAHKLTALQELHELEEVLPKLTARFADVVFSVDTFYGLVAEYALQNGVAVVNDISAGRFDPTLWPVVQKHGAPYVLMHMQGTPQTMQQTAEYTDVVEEVTLFLAEELRRLHQQGIRDVWIDPGFGFGKKTAHNYALLHRLKHLRILDAPILVGISRKSMITKVLQLSPEEALNGTTTLNTIALLNGADVLRVHDVHEAVEAVKLVKMYFSPDSEV